MHKQTNTNNVNKTMSLLQTTGDEVKLQKYDYIYNMKTQTTPKDEDVFLTKINTWEHLHDVHPNYYWDH